jgi:hypothetical protein
MEFQMPLNLFACQMTESQRLSSLVLFHEFRPYILRVYLCFGMLSLHRCENDFLLDEAYHVSCDMWHDNCNWWSQAS